jgi:elongation factor Ts
MSINAADIKKLREKTGARVMDCKKALEEAKGDFKKAEKLVEEKGLKRAEKTKDREVKVGFIASYVHGNATVASMVKLLCETDFVAANDEFRSLGKSIAMQIASMNPKDKEELLKQEFIKDPSVTIEDLLKKLSGKIGEKMEIGEFTRYEIG